MGEVVDRPQAQAESNRDRVRRLLFGPLGFRAPKGMGADALAALQDGLADGLSHMSDANLAVLRAMLASKGAGAARNQFPDKATVLGFAEVVQPRPVAEVPALRRWFGSVEGPRALAEGTLVETYRYFERCKAPPFTPGARRMVAEEAAANARRLQIIREKVAAGWVVGPEDQDWCRAYEAQLAALVALVERERAAREAGQ